MSKLVVTFTLVETGQSMSAELLGMDDTEYVYYTKEGEFLGGKEDSEKIYLTTQSKYDKAKEKVEWGLINLEENLMKGTQNEIVTHTIFIAFASMVWDESSGIREESFAIASATTNYLKYAKSLNLKCLEDVVMYENHFSYGAEQAKLDHFYGNRLYKNNSKNAIEAVINTLHPEIKIPYTNDYSQGADAWDGIDLVQSKRKNDHRNYIWSSDSKEILEKYRKERNGGVDVSKFTYKDKNYKIKALTIVGKTVFCKIFTNRTEKIDKGTIIFTINFR